MRRAIRSMRSAARTWSRKPASPMRNSPSAVLSVRNAPESASSSASPTSSVARPVPMKPQPSQVMPCGLATRTSARAPATSSMPRSVLGSSPSTWLTMICAARPFNRALAAMSPSSSLRAAPTALLSTAPAASTSKRPYWFSDTPAAFGGAMSMRVAPPPAAICGRNSAGTPGAATMSAPALQQLNANSAAASRGAPGAAQWVGCGERRVIVMSSEMDGMDGGGRDGFTVVPNAARLARFRRCSEVGQTGCATCRCGCRFRRAARAAPARRRAP
ncbi:hypothetical protein GALL_438220 [mine drainage metagenome]|uniref:Uncharacterized protein n=1 Tax=mine drainage metagenome TaxID=410659 RepID=A0A1J5Q3P5_9ZZZZ